MLSGEKCGLGLSLPNFWARFYIFSIELAYNFASSDVHLLKTDRNQSQCCRIPSSIETLGVQPNFS